MSEDSIYQDADIVWVKLGSSWWPGEVCGHQRQPEGFLQQAKRKPYCVVKFFQEDSFEYVKSSKHILPFNCNKKDEFIRKGHELFKAKKKFMEKFPSDVSTAERLTRSVTRSSLFFNSRPDSIVKAILGESPPQSDRMQNGRRCDNITKIINITPNRNSVTIPASNSPPTYKCSMCDFQSTRQNVMVLHRKSHSNSAATSSRSSLVNSSTMTLVSEKESENKSAAKSVSVGTSPPPTKTIIWQKPVRRHKNSSLLNNSIVISDESDYSSEEYNPEQKESNISNATHEDESLKQNEIITVTHNRPSHITEDTLIDKVDGDNARKSEDIQKSLLADWIDEDKDDEEEEDQSTTKEKKADLLILIENENLYTLASAGQLRRAEPSDQSECVLPVDSQKLSPIFRNPPKKNWLNIDFKGSSNCKELSKGDTSSQASREHTCQQDNFSDESRLPNIVKSTAVKSPIREISSIKTCVAEHTIADPYTAGSPTLEPLSTEAYAAKSLVDNSSAVKLNSGESFAAEMSIESLESPISEIYKTKSLVENPFAIKPNFEESFTAEISTVSPTVEQPTTKLCRNKHNVDKQSAVKPNSGESFAAEISTVSPTVVPPAIEPCTTKPQVDKKSVFKPNSSAVDSSLMKSFAEKPSEMQTSYVGQLTIKPSVVVELEASTTLLTAEKSSVVEITAVELYSSNTSMVKPLPVASSAVDISKRTKSKRGRRNLGPSKLAPPIKKTTKVEAPLAEKLIGASIRKPTKKTEKLSIVETYKMEQSTVKLSKVEALNAEPSTVKPPVGESLIAKQLPTLELFEVQPVTVESDIVETDIEHPSTTKSPTVTSSTIEPYAIKPTREKSSVIEVSPPIKKQPDIDGFAEESSKVEHSTAVKLSTLKLSADKLFIVEPSMGEISAVKAAEPFTVKLDSVDPCSKGPDIVTTPAINSNKGHSILEPNTLKSGEITGSKTLNSVSKPSLSCFDFQEEEDTDILTSIAKFKKKYISPEKNLEFGKESRPKTPDAQKLEMELKDKQLSADIECLLQTTILPVELAMSSTVSERSITHEVRGLPIKERGKRIFKSRNRFRIESSSVSTTSTMKAVAESLLPASRDLSRKETFLQEANSANQIHDVVKKMHINEKKVSQINEEESSADATLPEERKSMGDNLTNPDKEILKEHPKRQEIMDDKVTNSERETIDTEYSKSEKAMDDAVTHSGEEIVDMEHPNTREVNYEKLTNSEEEIVDVDGRKETEEAMYDKLTNSGEEIVDTKHPKTEDAMDDKVADSGEEIVDTEHPKTIEASDDKVTNSGEEFVDMDHPKTIEASDDKVTNSGEEIVDTLHSITEEATDGKKTNSGEEIFDMEHPKTKEVKDDKVTNSEEEVVETQHPKAEEITNENATNFEEKIADTEHQKKEEAMDDKVTNSEDEIVGRVVFSPAEVYAPSAENFSNESSDNRETHVSSSGIEVLTESVPVGDENLTTDISKGSFNDYAYQNQSKSSDIDLEETGVETEHNQTWSSDTCDVQDKRETNYIFSLPQSEKMADGQEQEQEFPQQEEHQEDDLNAFFVVEESEPIYEVEIYDADANSKPGESNYEVANEFELITNEVTNIVDRITSDEEPNITVENAIESLSSESATKASQVVTGSEVGKTLKEIVRNNSNQALISITDDIVTESQDSSMPEETETDNSYLTLKDMESTEPDRDVPSDESNSCSTIGNQVKDCYLEKDIYIETLEDESVQAEVERAETSSDDTSTVISDAEAEFGSPTSMLEEERVLNRGRSESEPPATNTECINNVTKVKGHNDKLIKKNARSSRSHLQSSRKEKRLLIHCDTQESTSNDVEQNSPHTNLSEKEHGKESVENKEHEKIEPFSLKQESLSEGKETITGKVKRHTRRENDVSDNQADILESNTESDSAEEEEEEISSPPIEPLQDESREAQTFHPCSTSNGLLENEDPGQSERYHQFQEEIVIENEVQSKTDIITNQEGGGKDELEPAIQSPPKAKEEEILPEKISGNGSIHEIDQRDVNQTELPVCPNSEKNGTNTQSSSGYYTITQKSDTIIKLNKYKGSEKSQDLICCKEWAENSNVGEKSEIAGEELSAAEALLLIPNQPSNILNNSNDLTETNLAVLEPSFDAENNALLVREIKEEIMDDSGVMSQRSEKNSQDEIPRESVRRKRRSHMKVTPRKRVIDVQSSDKSIEIDTTQVGAKIPKLTRDPNLAVAPKVEHQVTHKKTFAEQYEENFVLKYMKEQAIDEMDSVESSRSVTTDSDKSSNSVEKPTPEKVHITVDISNPLSSQIASILGTHRPSVTEVSVRGGAKKRKQTLEDDIPSFIIKRPCPKTVAEAEAADRETIAQIQNLCPHVEITRKSSKDDQSTPTAPLTQSTKPHIINQQILRVGNNQPIITVTPKSKKPEEGMFDISSMPIVLSNESVINEKLHIVITPTSNPDVIKQFQNQQQLILNPGASAGSFTTAPIGITNPGIPVRRASNVRTKRTPSRQQLQEQQNQEQQNQQKIQQQQNQEQENQQHHSQQQTNELQQNQFQQTQHQQNHHQQTQYHQNQQQQNLQQPYHQQLQLQQHQQHQLQHQQHHQLQQQQHHRQQQQRQHQQVQLQHQHQLQQQQHFQQQFAMHQQNQIQQQLQEEQQIFIQQHQQVLLQQQLQIHQHQQQLQAQQQLISSEKVAQTNLSDKQMGVDTRGNKYVIIKAPPNTVVMGNNSESGKGLQRLQEQHVVDTSNTNTQRKKNQSTNTSKRSLSHSPHVKSPHLSPLHVQSQILHLSPISVQQPILNQHQHFKEQEQLASPSTSDLPTTTTKAKGQGRGRRSKQSDKAEATPSARENTSKNVKNNTNGKRSSGTICDPPRQRSTRSTAANKKNSSMTPSTEVQLSSAADFLPAPIYTTTQQQTQSIVFMATQSIAASSSPVICTNNMPFQVQSSLSPRTMPRVMTGISIETSDGSGVGYAVPSLPVPGYPQTFLLCELIDKKYKEVYPKPLYLSHDRTRFFEVPDEFVTEAHRRLTDCRREPNSDVLQVVSDAVPHVLQSQQTEINTKIIVEQMQEGQHFQQQQVSSDKNVKLNDALMQKHEQLSVEEQASALLCLQEQIVQEQIAQEQLAHEQLAQNQLAQEQLVQEQLVQEQLVQEQLVQEQLVQEQLVQEQLVQEQLVQEQLVQEQLVQEQFVQDQLVQEQFVQDQFMQQQHIEGDQGLLQVATIETEEVQDNTIQQPNGVASEESIDTSQMVVLNIGPQQYMMEEHSFFDMIGQHHLEILNSERSTYTLSPNALQELLASFNASRSITAGAVFDGEVCEQHEIVMDGSMLHTAEASADILTVALDDSGLYSEEQFINSGDILQIETPDGLRLIGTAAGNAGIVFQPMTTPITAKTSETNVLLNQAPKMSEVEIPSDKSKPKFETNPSSTATLEDCLNVIGVSAQSPSVPTSLELPTSVTNPAIVAKTRTPTPSTITMNEIIATGLCHHPDITSLPSMGSNEQGLHYEFFSSTASSHDDKHINEESVVADMGEYAIVSSGGNFEDPGR